VKKKSVPVIVPNPSLPLIPPTAFSDGLLIPEKVNNYRRRRTSTGTVRERERDLAKMRTRERGSADGCEIKHSLQDTRREQLPNIGEAEM